jgi:hypothetical protein
MKAGSNHAEKGEVNYGRRNILEKESKMKSTRGKTPFALVIGLAFLALALILVQGAVPVFADTNGCPATDPSNHATSPNVGATFTVNGNTATYTFSSVNRNPLNGVPGLIEYCVFPNPVTAPDSTTASAIGANGQAWTEPPAFNNFSFQRPDGNASNIPLNGTLDVTMGTATWSGGVPPSQTIVLHINDLADCSALYPDKVFDEDNSTCFVLPFGPEPRPKDAQPPTVAKTANPSFEDKFTWTIDKAVDKTIVKQIGGTATFNYAITVTYSAPIGFGWQVIGTITVSNPNVDDITLDSVTDAVDNGGVCTVTDGTNVTVPGSGSLTLSYACLYDATPNPSAGTNTATAAWSDQTLTGGAVLAAGTADGTASFSFGSPSDNLDECVTVTDSFAGTLGTVCVGAPNPTTFTYSRAITVPQFDCQSFPNTATFTTNDTGATGSASQTVKVCGPADTGALTMGFWQNKNGQAIITGGAATSGVCNSGTWLRQYAPFQDLSATATCKAVGTYVTGVIKAANASGVSMNAMLKAQMLATALDVYFSDPTLGGNKINAPAPIGGVSIDLTMVCANIPTCSTFLNVSSAFGGATSKTVSEMLSFAASQSNAGGSLWYANVKSTQELAKDAFDAINNEVAFAP